MRTGAGQRFEGQINSQNVLAARVIGGCVYDATWKRAQLAPRATCESRGRVLDGLRLPLSGISAGADCFDFGKNVGGVFIGPIGGRRPGIEAKTVNAPAVAELAKKLLPGSQTQIHVPTLVFGLGILLLLRLLRWWSPRSPGPLVAVIIGTLLCFLFNLKSFGISLVDKISAVLPTLALHMTKGILA